jgi:leucyl-tRNA synthetase
MWERLGERGMLADSAWPEYDEAVAAVPEVTVVVQVGGKLRDRLTLPVGTLEKVVLEAALASDKVRSALNGKGPSKVIFVPDRLINLVP